VNGARSQEHPFLIRLPNQTLLSLVLFARIEMQVEQHALTIKFQMRYVSYDGPDEVFGRYKLMNKIESQFRTMKYQPEFPDRFGCIQDSRAFSQGFFPWYNEEHRHSSIGLLTPAMVHYNQTAVILEQRQTVLDAAYRPHPRTLRPPGTKTNGGPNRRLDQQTGQHK
jgi:hypothetical protein